MLAGDVRFLRDRHAAVHFLRRIQATLAEYHARSLEQQRALESLRMSVERSGRQSTLSPYDSAKFLTPEQLAELAGGRAAAELRAADKVRTEADTHRRAALAELNKLRFALSTVLETPSVDPATRRELRRLFEEYVSQLEPESTKVSESAAQSPTPPPNTQVSASVPAPIPQLPLDPPPQAEPLAYSPPGPDKDDLDALFS